MSTRIEYNDIPMEIRRDLVDSLVGLEGWHVVYALRIHELDYEGEECYYIHCSVSGGGCFGAMCRLRQDGAICSPPDNSPGIGLFMDMMALCAHLDIVPYISEQEDRIVVEVPSMHCINEESNG